MRPRSLLFVILVFAMASSCKRGDAPDCFKTAGEESSETRLFQASLRKVELNDAVDLTFFSSDEHKVIVKGPEYLLEDVTTSHENGVLHIRNENTCNWVRDLSIRMEVEVYTNELEYLNYKGQGDVLFQDTLKTDYFTFENQQGFGDVFLRFEGDSLNVINHDGYANLIIAGEARIAALFHQGIGRFDASEMRAVAVLSHNNSINAMHVYPVNYLFAKISNKGNTYFKGSPQNIDTDLSGTGELIPFD